MATISPITKAQGIKIAKSLAYSFAAGFTGVLTLQAFNVVQAAQSGTSGVIDLAVSLIAAAVIGGLNATFVAIKQLFTDPA